MNGKILMVLSGCLGFGMTNTAFAADYSGCLDARGKITNNAQFDKSTLGVVALNLQGDKYKCGIAGKPQLQTSPEDPAFKHTVVCDNKASADEAQAEATFNTFLQPDLSSFLPCPDFDPSDPSYSFSFEEISVPIDGSGRGLFTDIASEGSELYVSGDYNCDGGIVMKFTGTLCFAD